MNNPFTFDYQMNLAERELGAFLHVVAELYGPEEAKISSQDWLDELELLEYIPGLTPREWRVVTIAAANRLSKRVTKQGLGDKMAS
jgi:hypothetical protein